MAGKNSAIASAAQYAQKCLSLPSTLSDSVDRCASNFSVEGLARLLQAEGKVEFFPV
ncbi:hypothetical protein [Leptolyngbya ohadii]|uniref:hypothetical protein n=1 Tax=Leptolyngbya ohadii TaxID=1962290 RepID=UPI0015C68DC2|nr:hypothetical protein [Leptolyngbya ohadii]